MYHWVTASLFAIMSVWTNIGDSLAALLSEIACVLKKKKNSRPRAFGRSQPRQPWSGH